MRRRRRQMGEPERSALGLGNYREAIANIAKMADFVMEKQVPYTRDLKETIRDLVDPDILAKLQAAKPYLNQAAYSYYRGNDVTFKLDGYELEIDFEDSGSLPVKAEHIALRHGTLLATLNEMQKIHDQWMQIHSLVAWMDWNCTIGAIRHYFPTIMSFAPNCQELKEAETTRFKEPDGISHWLPVIREAAGTIMAVMFLGEPKPKGCSGSPFSVKLLSSLFRDPKSADTTVRHSREYALIFKGE